MGLNIRAYSNIKPSQDEEDGIRVMVNDFFNVHGDLHNGYYETKDPVVSYRAGSCSTYGVFREKLAVMAGYQNVREAWNKDAGPFWEMINFSDVEGAIGEKVCEKLYHDFVVYEDVAKRDLSRFDFEAYLKFKELFEKGRHKGCVTYNG